MPVIARKLKKDPIEEKPSTYSEEGNKDMTGATAEEVKVRHAYPAGGIRAFLDLNIGREKFDIEDCGWGIPKPVFAAGDDLVVGRLVFTRGHEPHGPPRLEASSVPEQTIRLLSVSNNYSH